MPYAAVVYAMDQPMRIEEVRYRAPRENEVFVKLAACGVCHSDLSVLNEYYPCPTPVILGHEAAGVVEEVGEKVTGVARGDHVIGVWRPSCGECRYCRAGKQQLCKRGDEPTARADDRVTADDQAVWEFLGVGGFSEYSLLTDDQVVKIDPSMPLDRAALLGCAVLTGWGAAESGAGVEEGDEVAIFGCGGVGLNVIQGARHAGAQTIVAVDLDDDKLEIARQFGATHTLNASASDLGREIRHLTRDAEGVDYAFDAVGNVGIIETAYASVCKGGEVICVGIAHRKEKFSLSQIATVLMEKTIRGSLAGSLDPYTALPRLVSSHQSGELKLDELVTRTYTIREAQEAMEDLRAGKNARGVLVFDT